MGAPKVPNNDVDLGNQAAVAAKQQAQQQAQWAAEQNATNQASAAQAALLQQQTNQITGAATDQANQFAQQNAAQGAAQNATGGPAGIKAASTLEQGTAGLSPADQKLQAAGLAADPNSLQALMAKKASMSSAPGAAPGGLLSSSNVKLGGS